MAEQITHDVVKEAQSMGDHSPIDETAASTNHPAGDGEAPSAPPSETTTNATSTAAVDDIPVTDKADDVSAKDPSKTEAAEQIVNGDSGEHSAPGDGSVSSDTDISRPGSVDQAKERPAGHLRSNSVKKPASFKSVSVTKNFLAKSAVSVPSVRPGDKGTPAGQTNASTMLMAKPRLVAKSGSGLGNMSRSSLTKTNGAGAGPDASKVWNKNQPVPPPPPKQFTDEELKQQYGIHLATRLQADEAGKEAKWADIDDDEDDWAPDTVQWMDGTKSTVARVENQPPPPDELKLESKNDSIVEATKPAPTPASNPQRPNSTTGTKTILKPGAHVQPSSGKTGLVLKGQPEKPTLVAKPSAPTPVKSPWAPLPPVEKVSPIQINPPVQQPQPSRFSQRDSHGYDAMGPPPTQAKEIAPDDFNRSWRDDRGNRELFNSHSGRYEPVNETRRGSTRDNNFRQQPSVLQRPSQDAPAEPSAAFQTSRNSVDGPVWSRRRNSSNVSGGSGRRMSMDRRVPDMPALPMNIQRRESQSINGTDAFAPGTPRHVFSAQKGSAPDSQHAGIDQNPSLTQISSPNLSNAQPLSPFGSVGSSALQDGTTPGAPVQIEDPVEVQNRLMREKLERARLAKQKEREREEQEEAERKERLRKKLEAMGLTDDSKTKTKDRSPSRPEKSPPKDKALPVPVQSPPKPPVPTSEGEVAQYGMMKVHQPHPVKKPQHSEYAPSKSLRGAEAGSKPSAAPAKAQNEVNPKPATSLTEVPLQASAFARDDNRNGRLPSEQLQTEAPHPEGDIRSTNQVLPPAQASQASQGPWSTPGTRQPGPWGSNVWGPPQAKDRALGNGTFDSNYTRGQPRPSPPQLPSQAQAGQGPALGLNPPLKPSSSQQQVAPSQPFTKQTIFSQSESISAQQSTNVTSKPGPIAPPVDKSWGNFANAIRLDDQAMAAKARQDLERVGGETFRPEIRETYTDQQGRSQKTLHGKAGSNVPLATNGIKQEISQLAPVDLKPKEEVAKVTYATSVASEAPIGPGVHLSSTGPGARSSRFFPRASETVNQPSTSSSKSDSPPPPPPETESHPAFAGDSHHPVVKMPKPSPRVRLPPAATEHAVHPEAPVSMPPRSRLGLGARPLALDPEWQARFNSLLEKSPPAPGPVSMDKTSSKAQQAVHTKLGSLAVAASSKAPLEVRENLSSATVSLPNVVTKKPFVDDSSRDVITRVTPEEVLLEEREFGSLPVVKTPKVPHLAANEPTVGFPPVRSNSRFQRPLEIMTKTMFTSVEHDRNSDTIDVRIRLSNMRETKFRSMAKKRETRKSPGHKGPKRNTPQTNNQSNAGQNQRPRKPSNYQGQASGSTSNSNSSSRPSGNSGWNRSSPAHTSTTWPRRAAPVH